MPQRRAVAMLAMHHFQPDTLDLKPESGMIRALGPRSVCGQNGATGAFEGRATRHLGTGKGNRNRAKIRRNTIVAAKGREA